MLVDKASQKAERRQNKRNPEAILRKRAKKRAKYIAKLVEEGELFAAVGDVPLSKDEIHVVCV